MERNSSPRISVINRKSFRKPMIPTRVVRKRGDLSEKE